MFTILLRVARACMQSLSDIILQFVTFTFVFCFCLVCWSGAGVIAILFLLASCLQRKVYHAIGDDCKRCGVTCDCCRRTTDEKKQTAKEDQATKKDGKNKVEEAEGEE